MQLKKNIITVYRYGKSEHFIKELCYFTLSVPLLPSIFKKEKCNNVRYNSSYTHNFSIIVTLIQWRRYTQTQTYNQLGSFEYVIYLIITCICRKAFSIKYDQADLSCYFTTLWNVSKLIIKYKFASKVQIITQLMKC